METAELYLQDESQILNENLNESEMEIYDTIEKSLSGSKNPFSMNKSYTSDVSGNSKARKYGKHIDSNYITFGISRKGRISNDDALLKKVNRETITGYSTNEFTEKAE
eukprot:CAMPEP_0168327120 /NCGR_PEP_ID=MMETSP0213-20121227/5718_1 /TAXON_ID=151035 /ORGANISM="Euplotes harpa, Strain FSP1.4" /LENGTH=107 /DNA_ID=CAMNT_0008329983 /DNA_START=531 /DNA_END=854 /DNA_ORIENTATION=+